MAAIYQKIIVFPRPFFQMLKWSIEDSKSLQEDLDIYFSSNRVCHLSDFPTKTDHFQRVEHVIVTYIINKYNLRQNSLRHTSFATTLAPLHALQRWLIEEHIHVNSSMNFHQLPTLQWGGGGISTLNFLQKT